jgi:hypothetical protein
MIWRIYMQYREMRPKGGRKEGQKVAQSDSSLRLRCFLQIVPLPRVSRLPKTSMDFNTVFRLLLGVEMPSDIGGADFLDAGSP